MSRSAYRNLIFGVLVAGVIAWLVIPRLLGNPGPRSARAAAEPELTADPAQDDLAPLAAACAIGGEWARDGPSAGPWPDDPFHYRRSATAGTEDVPPAATAAATAQPAAFVLSAVLSGTAPRAIVNGQVLAVGDRLPDGPTLVAIDAFSVTLSGPKGTWTLRLSE